VTTTEYKLYCFAQSGNCFKVALMLNLCDASWAPRFVDFFNGETRTPEYRANVNEMGEAPVLEFGGRRMSQSGVILDYLASVFGKFGWKDEEGRREILRWLLWDNHKFTSYIGTLRFLMRFQKTGETAATELLRARVLGSLVILDRHLKDQKFIVGNAPTIADISACGYLFWPDEFGMSWGAYPAIEAWLDRIQALPGWVHPYQLMPGHPLPERKG
jgi:glutathione S-transferase